MASACFFVCIFWRSYEKVRIVYMFQRTHDGGAFVFYHPNFCCRNDYDKNNRDFFGGIERNLHRIQTDFPGSLMRLYYHVQNKSLFLRTACKLACTVPIFDLCDVERIPSMGKLVPFLYFYHYWCVFNVILHTH